MNPFLRSLNACFLFLVYKDDSSDELSDVLDELLMPASDTEENCNLDEDDDEDDDDDEDESEEEDNSDIEMVNGSDEDSSD